MKKLGKKLVATLLAAVTVMAMSVTAFAATPTEDGSYSVTPTLYKDEACTETSMGNDALVSAELEITGDTATLYLTTKDLTVTRLGITVTGKLKSMILYDKAGTAHTAEADKDDAYTFIVSDIPVSDIVEGVTFESTFEATVSIIPVNMSGYLKLTNITAM